MELNHGANCPCSEFKLSMDSDNINGLIDFNTLSCLNQRIPNSCKTIFREEEDKHKPNQQLCVSVINDPELLFIVRFREEVKIRAINVITDTENVISQLNVYINEENVSFDLTNEPPAYSFEINHFTPKGEFEVYTNVQKCKNIHNIVLHFKGNSKSVGVKYIGLKGVGKEAKRMVMRGQYETLSVSENKTNVEDIKHGTFMGV